MSNHTRLRLGQRVEVPQQGAFACRVVNGVLVRGTTPGRVRALESDRVQVETSVRLQWWPLALVRPAPLPKSRWDRVAKRWVSE
jgi:translation initiation factor IF-1